MTSPRLAAMLTEHETLVEGIDAIEGRATSEARDLTEAESADVDRLFTRAAEMKPEIQKLSERAASLAETAAVLSRITPASAPIRTNPVTREVTAGEYVGALVRANLTGDRTEFETITRALAHQTTADNPGIIPTTIVGPLVEFVDYNRPAVNSSQRMPLPQAGKNFYRPRVTQNTQVGVQATEGDVLASRKFTITSDTLTKAVYGGTLALSESDLDWAVGDLMAIVTRDLAGQYALQTDTAMTAAIQASVTTNKTILSLTAAPAAFIAAIIAASAAVYASSKHLPDTIYAGVGRWAYLLGLSDSTGRQLFGATAPQNSSGTGGPTQFQATIMGLNVVVDPNFSTDFIAVAASSGVESFEQDKGLLSVAAPSTLETIVAYRGYFVPNVYPQAIQGLPVS